MINKQGRGCLEIKIFGLKVAELMIEIFNMQGYFGCGEPEINVCPPYVLCSADKKSKYVSTRGDSVIVEFCKAF